MSLDWLCIFVRCKSRCDLFIFANCASSRHHQKAKLKKNNRLSANIDDKYIFSTLIASAYMGRIGVFCCMSVVRYVQISNIQIIRLHSLLHTHAELRNSLFHFRFSSVARSRHHFCSQLFAFVVMLRVHIISRFDTANGNLGRERRVCHSEKSRWIDANKFFYYKCESVNKTNDEWDLLRSDRMDSVLYKSRVVFVVLLSFVVDFNVQHFKSKLRKFNFASRK